MNDIQAYQNKYRPQKVADLDLPEVREKLTSLLKSAQRAQALLFFGPKGSGKTSAARIVAKAVNCLAPSGIEPCDQCATCNAINTSASLDILEIDAASNRGIDDVRRLKEQASLSPVSALVKVFIIDEVHMLTKEAFNALLKLLEEPPEKTLFILCTTEKAKIPDTVLSRLYQIPFRRATLGELTASLEKTLPKEKLKIGMAVLEEVAKAAGGSFRDAKKLLGQIVTEAGDREIGVDLVATLLAHRRSDEDVFWQLFDKNARKELLEYLAKMAEIGSDMGLFREHLLQQTQVLMFDHYTEKKYFRLAREFLRASTWEKQSSLADLPLQMALVAYWAKTDPGTKSESIKAKPKPITDISKVKKTSVLGKNIDNSSWVNLLTAVKPHNHSVEAFLRSCKPLEIRGNEFVIEVFYPFHKERLEDPRNQVIVETGLRQVFEQELRVKFVLGKKGGGSTVMSQPKEKKQEIEYMEEDLFLAAKNIF